MSGTLSDKELAELIPSELVPTRTPVPTQIVASDEFYPDPQNEQQREVEARVLAMADELGAKQNLDRRRFFQTASGMAASFVAMNEVYGSIFDVSRAEAATPAQAQERAAKLKGQFIMDMHTHFLRDDTRIMNFVNMRNSVGKAGWNKSLAEKEQTIEDLKYANYMKEMFLDSDTKIALISSAPSDTEQDWFLTNEQMAAARDKVNKEAGGTTRLLSHMIFTPGQPGWLDKLDAGLALKPNSVKGYTIGDNTHKATSKYPVAYGRREDRLQGLRENGGRRRQERLHPQGAVRTVDREAVSAFARVLLRRRRRASREGLAAAQFHHLPLGLPPRRRRSEGGARRVRADGPRFVDERPRRYPRTVWRQERLWRRRSAVCDDAGGTTARVRSADGHSDQGPRRRPRELGHRRGLDRLAPVADRRIAEIRDPSRHAEEIWLQTTWRPGQSGEAGDFRREQRTALRHHAAKARGARNRQARSSQGRL